MAPDEIADHAEWPRFRWTIRVVAVPLFGGILARQIEAQRAGRPA